MSKPPTQRSSVKTQEVKGVPTPTEPSQHPADVSGSSIEMIIEAEVGRTINGRYEVTRVIGEGGMGVVYEAYDRQVDRNVAIKLVRSESLADRKFITRFRREMEVTTQLRHPSTIRVFEHGETETGRPYMVMELLQGESLADLMERGRVPEKQALQYARQIAESLSEAHEHGIFHRDLKPDNIFVETVGVSKVVKVLDFGIAGGLDASRLTQAGEVFGTPQYMSPEQCNGQALDHRTDIYSLGCILYEMLEGKPPFSAESPMATMLKHVRTKFPLPRHSSRPSVELLQKALRKDRTKRIQTCGRFAELIGECIGAVRAKQQDDTGPTSPLAKPSETTGRHQANSDGRIHITTGPTTIGEMPHRPMSSWIVPLGLGLFIVIALAIGAKSFLGDGEDDIVEVAPKVVRKLPTNRAYVKTNVNGASVLLDGVLQCQTPCYINVPLGDHKKHQINVRKEGFVEVMQIWQPKSPSESMPLLPDLRPLSGGEK